MKNVNIVVDIHDYPVGYFIWAFVNNNIHQALLDRKGIALSPEDWNGGSFLWIIDYRFPNKKPLSMIRRVIDCFPGERIYTF